MKYFMFAVAPRMGSVDRNIKSELNVRVPKMSLPAWGAWIEILIITFRRGSLNVAPRMGSVDRNEDSRRTIKE